MIKLQFLVLYRHIVFSQLSLVIKRKLKLKMKNILEFKTTPSDSLPYHTLSVMRWTTQRETQKTRLWKITEFRRTSAAEFPGDGLHCSTEQLWYTGLHQALPGVYLHLRPRTLSHGATISQLEHKSKVILQTSLSVFRESLAFVTATMQ